MELEEMRLTAYESSRLYKERVKTYHDKKLLKKNFQPGQQVLLFNSRLKLLLGTLKSKWVVNGQRLKLYHGGTIKRLTTILSFQE